VRPHKLQDHSFDVFGKVKQNSKSSFVLTSNLTSGETWQSTLRNIFKVNIK